MGCDVNSGEYWVILCMCVSGELRGARGIWELCTFLSVFAMNLKYAEN